MLRPVTTDARQAMTNHDCSRTLGGVLVLSGYSEAAVGSANNSTKLSLGSTDQLVHGSGPRHAGRSICRSPRPGRPGAHAHRDVSTALVHSGCGEGRTGGRSLAPHRSPVYGRRAPLHSGSRRGADALFGRHAATGPQNPLESASAARRVTVSNQPHYAYAEVWPARSRRKPSSSSTGTPSSWAFASFEPALSPATR